MKPTDRLAKVLMNFVQDVNHAAYQGFLVGYLAELKLLFNPEDMKEKSFVEIGAMLTHAADQKAITPLTNCSLKRTIKFVDEAVELNIL